MKSRPLFGDAEPGAVAAAIADPRFQAAAMISLGRRDIWESALTEVTEIYQRHVLDDMGGQEPALSMDNICELIMMLADRTKVQRDRNVCCNMMMRAFKGIPLPLATRLYERPQDEQRRWDRKWLDDYRKGGKRSRFKWTTDKRKVR